MDIEDGLDGGGGCRGHSNVESHLMHGDLLEILYRCREFCEYYARLTKYVLGVK